MHHLSSRRVATIAAGIGLLLLTLVPVAGVGAQVYPYPNTNPYPYQAPGAPPAVAPVTPGVIPAAQATATPTASAAPAVVPVPVVVSTSGYPPNALISSYFDPRYCGNGAVSVVTDAGGALINVCTSTGQRVVPIYPDFAPAPFAPSVLYGTGAYTYGYFGNGATSGYTYGYATGYTGNRQYTDNNSNCPIGDVTQTASGFFCTANGAPAVHRAIKEQSLCR